MKIKIVILLAFLAGCAEEQKCQECVIERYDEDVLTWSEKQLMCDQEILQSSVSSYINGNYDSITFKTTCKWK